MAAKLNYKEEQKSPTCSLKPIFSRLDLHVMLDIKDRGNTKAALPTKARTSNIELTPSDVPGL